MKKLNEFDYTAPRVSVIKLSVGNPVLAASGDRSVGTESLTRDNADINFFGN